MSHNELQLTFAYQTSPLTNWLTLSYNFPLVLALSWLTLPYLSSWTSLPILGLPLHLNWLTFPHLVWLAFAYHTFINRLMLYSPPIVFFVCIINIMWLISYNHGTAYCFGFGQAHLRRISLPYTSLPILGLLWHLFWLISLSSKFANLCTVNFHLVNVG